MDPSSSCEARPSSSSSSVGDRGRHRLVLSWPSRGRLPGGQLYYDHLPSSLGFDTVPVWWCLPALFIAGFITAFAIDRLPGGGGHIPAEGLKASPTKAIALPGVVLAAVASIGLGVVLGPEAPLMAIGGGMGFLLVRMVKSDAPPALGQLISVAGIFAGLSFLFGSPVIAAVIVIEASGLGGRRLPLLLIPGLLAAGIGSVVSTGLGSWTGVNMSDITIQLLKLPSYPTPDLVSFLWTVPLAVVIAAATYLIFRIGRATQEQAKPQKTRVQKRHQAFPPAWSNRVSRVDSKGESVRQR
jgi:H+/Cl- antiporter ClcA